VLGANSTVSIDVFQVSHVRTTGTNGSGAIGVRDIDAANRTASGAIALTTPGTSNGNLIVAVYACDVNYGGLAYPVMKPPAGFAFAATPRTPAGLVTGSPVGPTGLLVAFRNSGVPGVTFTQPGATHSLGAGVELIAG